MVPRDNILGGSARAPKFGLSLTLIAFVIFLLGLLWSTVIIHLRDEREAEIRGAMKNTSNLARAFEEHTLRTIREADQVLLFMLEAYRQQGAKLDLRRLGEGGSIGSGIYIYFSIIDERGMLAAGSRPFTLMDLSDREHFRVHVARDTNQLFISQPVVGRASGKTSIQLSRRINKPDLTFGGVAVVSVDPEYFSGFYGQLDLGKQGVVTLVGRDDAMVRARRSGEDTTIAQDMRNTPLFSQLRTSGHGSYMTVSAMDGVMRILSYRTLADYPLVVAVGVATDEALASFNKRSREDLLAAALVSLVILGFTAYLLVLISRRQRTEKTLRQRNIELAGAAETNARLATIVESSNDAIVSRTPDGTILSWNAAAERLFGYTAAEAIGRSTSMIIPPEREEELVRNRALLAQGRAVIDYETVRLAKGGRRVDVSLSQSPTRDDSGAMVGSSLIFRDITERLAAEENLRLAAALIENSNEGIMISDASNHIISVNPAFTRITGYTPDDAIGKRPSILSSGMQDEEFYRGMWAAIRETGRWQGEIWDRRKNGEIYCEWLSISTVKNPSGETVNHTAIISDITKNKRTAETQARLAAIVESSNDAIVSRALDGTILSWNEAAEGLFGHSANEVIGQSINLIVPPAHHSDAERNSRLLLDGGHVPPTDVVRLTKDGRLIDVMHSISPIKSEAGATVGAAIIFRDISQRKQAEERIDYLAHYDTVTGLPNRRLFNDRLSLALARDKRLGATTAVLLLDLDRFKQINESLGHSVGDKVLQAVTARLKERLREVDTVARLGGDEFAVILESVTDKAQALSVAEKIVQMMVEPITLEGEEIVVTASVGVALYPADADSVEKLIENAELAMYQAKQDGRNAMQPYVPEQSSRRSGSLGMESKLRRAIERDELLLHFQPKVDIRTGAITGAEALVRWRNPELGLVSPANFIPLAEETGLIVPIGEWVLHSACTQVKAWHRQGYPIGIAVNLSARQFRLKNLCEMVRETLADCALDAGSLELEITESMIMHRPEQTIATLQQLHDIGVTLSVDDFGTGYSSLSYLKRFPVHKLKVDQSFVRELHKNADDAAIVRAVVALAKSLNLKIIAEGVETEQQLIYLAGLHCDEYQGYYFSKPLPAAEFLHLLQGAVSLAPA